MLKKILIPVLLVLALVITGCASVPTESEINKEVVGYELPKKASPDKALICVIRPQKLNAFYRFGLYLDEKKPENRIGTLGGLQYACFEIEPGNHAILSDAANVARYETVFEGNKTYFIEQVPVSTATLIPLNKLVGVNENYAKYYVKRLEKAKFGQ